MLEALFRTVSKVKPSFQKFSLEAWVLHEDSGGAAVCRGTLCHHMGLVYASWTIQGLFSKRLETLFVVSNPSDMSALGCLSVWTESWFPPEMGEHRECNSEPEVL